MEDEHSQGWDENRDTKKRLPDQLNKEYTGSIDNLFKAAKSSSVVVI